MADPNFIGPTQPDKLDKLISMGEAFLANKSKESEDKKANTNKNLVKGLAKNTGAMMGLTTGMLSIKNIFGQAAKDNKEVIKQLSLFSTATASNSKQLLANLDTGYTTLKEELGTQSDIFAAGLGVLSKGNTESFTAMKALGINVAEAAQFTQFNTQALGMGMDGAVDLAESLTESSRANAQVTDNLIKALSSMQQALKKTSVELGPEMTKNMQAVVARMAQDNTAMSGDIASFVSSFMSGEGGFMKSTKLGVGFTGQETEQQLVEKIQLLSERIVQMGAGAQGFGGGVTFQRFEDAFGLSRENFMVAEKFGRNIEGLRRDSNKDAAETLKSLDSSRAVEVGMRDIQATAVEVQQGIAATLSPLSTLIPAILTALVAANTLLGVIAFKPAGLGGAMKGMGTKLAGSGALRLAGMGTAGLMMGKDALDMATGEDGGMSGKNIGGVAGGAIGAAIGSVLLPGIGTWVGMGLGNMIGGGIGSMMDPDESDDLAITAEAAAKQQRDTEEIRRIQERQDRDRRSLANPQMHILTTINNTLVRNLAVLSRTATQTTRQTELAEDAKFSNSGSAPSLSQGMFGGALN
mgnify:CR=1 FL=1